MDMEAKYIDSMGSDLTVVNSARVSFDKQSEWDVLNGEKTLKYNDTRLINYLAKHKHFTPFTHCTVTLRETVPLFVARQRFKHTVGFSYNEVSRRYIDSEPDFYYPDKWRKRATDKKQGSSAHYVNVKKTGHSGFAVGYEEAIEFLLVTYYSLLSQGVCPEQARMILPQSTFTSYYVTGSLFAFARAYMLRSSQDAQEEIRYLAAEWDKVLGKLYPISWKALTKGENSGS